MAKYLVTILEKYNGKYEVDADTKGEAYQKVLDDIYEGRRHKPDNCYYSGCNVEEMAE